MVDILRNGELIQVPTEEHRLHLIEHYPNVFSMPDKKAISQKIIAETKEELMKIPIQDLRAYAAEIGIKYTTMPKKTQMVDDIWKVRQDLAGVDEIVADDIPTEDVDEKEIEVTESEEDNLSDSFS